jgi:hypothetical protein
MTSVFRVGCVIVIIETYLALAIVLCYGMFYIFSTLAYQIATLFIVMVIATNLIIKLLIYTIKNT